MPHTPVNRCVRSHERHPFKAACVNELEFSPTKPFGEKERNSNVVRRTMWRKKVISTFKGGGMRQNYSNSKDSKHPGGAGRAGGRHNQEILQTTEWESENEMERGSKRGRTKLRSEYTADSTSGSSYLQKAQCHHKSILFQTWPVIC